MEAQIYESSSHQPFLGKKKKIKKTPLRYIHYKGISTGIFIGVKVRDYFFTYKQATTCLRLLIASEVQSNVLNVLFTEILQTLQVILAA